MTNNVVIIVKNGAGQHTIHRGHFDDGEPRIIHLDSFVADKLDERNAYIAARAFKDAFVHEDK